MFDFFDIIFRIFIFTHDCDGVKWQIFQNIKKIEQSSKNLDEMNWICFANKKALLF